MITNFPFIKYLGHEKSDCRNFSFYTTFGLKNLITKSKQKFYKVFTIKYLEHRNRDYRF